MVLITAVSITPRNRDLRRGDDLQAIGAIVRARRHYPGGQVFLVPPEISIRRIGFDDHLYYVGRVGDAPLSFETQKQMSGSRFFWAPARHKFRTEDIGPLIVPGNGEAGKLVLLTAKDKYISTMLDMLNATILPKEMKIIINENGVECPHFMVQRVADAVSLLTGMPVEVPDFQELFSQRHCLDFGKFWLEAITPDQGEGYQSATGSIPGAFDERAYFSAEQKGRIESYGRLLPPEVNVSHDPELKIPLALIVG